MIGQHRVVNIVSESDILSSNSDGYDLSK
jgi:hypothetical protein